MQDLTGRTFGLWTVVAFKEVRGPVDYRWTCRCACGTIRDVKRDNLMKGESKSCGCQRVKDFVARRTKHGMYESPVYKVWTAMKQRCLNSKNPEFKNYGARGIKVCAEWLVFENFLADMGEPPPEMSIEREDNSGNYEKSNCRWATSGDQLRNTRRTRLLTFHGETMCLADWAVRLDIHWTSLHKRLKRWPMEEALTRVKQVRLQTKLVPPR